MKYIDEFRDVKLAKDILNEINKLSDEAGCLRLMEVCGTHTMAISRFGLRTELPSSIKLISGPGCPVCVTSQGDIDTAILAARKKDVIICTFGDMVRVPGDLGSLESARSDGADIRVVYSPLDCIKIAKDNSGKKVIFIGVGFETTAPAVALTIEKAEKENVTNFYIICLHKPVPPALELLAKAEDINIDGFLLPGHVSAVLGADAYNSVLSKYSLVGVVTGFELLDILLGIKKILHMVKDGTVGAENAYKRVVKSQGNATALKVIEEVFEFTDSEWRGLGVIPSGGYKVKKVFERFDAIESLGLEVIKSKPNELCACGDILKGKINPTECSMFGSACTPQTPIGPCMVSTEGACAAYYKYERVSR